MKEIISFDDKKPVLHKKTIKKKIILHKKISYPFEKEIHILLGSTKNRMFLTEYLYLEVKYVSEYLEKVYSEHTEEKFYDILNYAKTILENMSNMGVGQAIESAIKGTTWTHFKNTLKKE